MSTKDLYILQKFRTAGLAEQLGLDSKELNDFFDRIEKSLNDEESRCEKKLIIHTDAAARGNPGPAGIGVVIQNDNERVLKEFYQYIGEQTNNSAEYMAFIKGLEIAKELEADSVRVNTDSELLANQLNGVYRVKNKALIELYMEAKKMINLFAQVEIVHVQRNKNKDADRLANLAIDSMK